MGRASPLGCQVEAPGQSSISRPSGAPWALGPCCSSLSWSPAGHPQLLSAGALTPSTRAPWWGRQGSRGLTWEAVGITGHTGSPAPVSLPPWDVCDPGSTGWGRVLKALPRSAHRAALCPSVDSDLSIRCLWRIGLNTGRWGQSSGSAQDWQRTLGKLRVSGHFLPFLFFIQKEKQKQKEKHRGTKRMGGDMAVPLLPFPAAPRFRLPSPGGRHPRKKAAGAQDQR